MGGWWDVYAILRRHRRPVEYLSFPDAVHVPFKPWERQTSQEGAVDWYDFWLNREEDPDPAKAKQYRRWRELRRQHEAALAELCAGGGERRLRPIFPEPQPFAARSERPWPAKPTPSTSHRPKPRISTSAA